MKRLLSVVLVTLLMVSVFGGCNKKDSGTTTGNGGSGSKKVTVWAWDPNFNIPIMNEAAKRYMEKNKDVKIEVVDMAKADVEQKLNTSLSSNIKDGLPDIVLIEDYNGQKYLQSYPGKFVDLTNELNYKDFVSYKTKTMTIDNKLYGLPFDSGVAGLFYRKDILEEAGFKADDLKNITWKQFIEIGKTVKEKTGKYFLGFETTDGDFMRIMLQSAGQWYFDKDGKPALTSSPALKEAMEAYKAIVDAKIAKPTAGWNEWIGVVNSGDAATMIAGVWVISSLKAPTDQSGKWAVAPVPRLETAGSVNASNLGGSSWYILNDAANKDIAIDFMKTIYAQDKDFYQTILINNGAVGSYIPGIEGDAYDKPDPFFDNVPVYKDLSAWAREIPSVDYGSYTYEADAAVMSQIDAYCDGSMSIDEALEAAQKQLENLIQ